MNYKTYAGAKIANPDCEIVTTGKNWDGAVRIIGTFDALDASSEGHVVSNAAWVICNPADYCSTLKEFLDAGFKLVEGDKFIGIGGYIVSVENADASNMRDDEDDEFRYILSAAALNSGSKVPTKDEKWTIYSNTLPLSKLSDEQAAQLFNAWRAGGEVEFDSDLGQWLRADDYVWIGGYVCRIKQKSGRDLFIEASAQLMTSETECTMEQMFGAQFDAGARYKDLTQFFGENI